MTNETTLSGTVLEIQRMSTEDGPGIRTSVFMKGCPMRCLWCHNPESIPPQPQVRWIGMRCIGCKTCLGICPRNALTMRETGLAIDRALCDGCGDCAVACPSTALELLGKKWQVAALVSELLKDREFFEQSGGGITVSGGEATLQWQFVNSLLHELKRQGIHTAIDTCGITRRDALEAILPYADLVLFDLKESDPRLHHEFTHSSLAPVLETLDFIAKYMQMHAMPAELWIRTPLIPGATARVENISALGKLIAVRYTGAVERWDLLAFNNLCKDKYQRLGLDWIYKDTPLLTRGMLEQLASAAMASGVRPEIVHWSGATHLKEETVQQTSPNAKPTSCSC